MNAYICILRENVSVYCACLRLVASTCTMARANVCENVDVNEHRYTYMHMCMYVKISACIVRALNWWRRLAQWPARMHLKNAHANEYVNVYMYIYMKVSVCTVRALD